MDKLLTHRRAVKKKKPNFIRQDAHKKVRVGNKWRKPKGSDSKMRVSRKGYHRCVSIGWGSPKAIKGFTRDGLRPVPVGCRKDIDSVDPKTECIIIIASVGIKKRLDLLAFAKEKGVKIANIKDVDAYVNLQKKRLDSKKKLSSDKKKKRSAEKEKAKKEAEKKKAEEKKSEEKAEEKKSESADTKSQEKKEQDKILTKRK